MVKRVTGWCLIGLVAGAGALSAQEAVPPFHVPPADHAAIGTLTMFDMETRSFTITTLDQKELRFQFDAESAVRGLIKCKDVAALQGEQGAGLVVHFVEEEGLPLALSVHYLGKAPLYQVKGIVRRIDMRDRLVVIEEKAGGKRQFELARRAPIDGPNGIIPLGMASEIVGRPVTVYYTPAGDVNLAVLMKQRGLATT